MGNNKIGASVTASTRYLVAISTLEYAQLSRGACRARKQCEQATTERGDEWSKNRENKTTGYWLQ
jgi:hypothetical protein